MSKARQRAAECLSDHHGTWCAWCVDYVGADFELHHVLESAQLARSQELMAVGFEGSWVVPVHSSKHGCHRGFLQPRASSAGEMLTRTAAFGPDALLKAASDAFFHGALGSAAALHEVAARQALASGETVRAFRELQYALGSLAGAKNSLRRLPRLVEVIRQVAVSLAGDMPRQEIVLYAATVELNSGSSQAAVEKYSSLENAVGRWRRESHRLFGVWARRWVIIEPKVSFAKEALVVARHHGDAYPVRTALLSLAWAHVVEQQYSQAVTCFDELLSRSFDSPRPSWWQISGAHFGRGCANFLWQGIAATDQVLRDLLVAQYIDALLGLQGSPRIGLLDADLSTPLTVSALIRRVGEQADPSVATPDFMRAIREDAIIGTGLRARVLEVLDGRY